MRFARALPLALLLGWAAASGAFVPGGDPRVDPDDFEVTTWASALGYPMGATQLRDGSILVGVSQGGGLGVPPIALVRLVDSNDDGVADGPAVALYTNLSGPAFSLARIDEWVIASTHAAILILRQDGNASSPLTRVGQVDLTYPASWWHGSTSLVGLRRATTPGRLEILFNIGSEWNDLPSTNTVAASGMFTGMLLAESIYRWTVDVTGPAPSTVALTRIASGLRNAFTGGFDPIDGSLVLADNGIDSPANPREPLSADELNIIAAGAVGGSVENFGFPTSYEAYRTGISVGTTGLRPRVAFQPIPPPNGAESEGASGLAFAPFRFPAGLERGVFVGFHGQFERAGTANEENAVVFAELPGGSYFQFIASGEPEIGHPDTLLSTADALYVFDLSSSGPTSGPASGAIHRIKLAQSCAGPGGDLDRDGVCDDGPFAACSCLPSDLPGCVASCADNCPLRVNPDQLDRTADGIGDACTCGDLDGDGDVDSGDSGAYRARLAGAPAPFSRDRCNLGSSSACDLRDSVRLRRSLAGQLQGTANPSACDAVQFP